MDSDFDACFAAVAARDSRFDGRFYTGVRSTGIYCRPSCPSRTPLPRNVGFYRSAAAAEQAGFRACRRCRPDRAPGSVDQDVSAELAVRAVRGIEAGVVDQDGVDGLARRLHVSARHLGRIVTAELGASPAALARSRRVRLARLLLDQTDLGVADVAFAAGFSSVRRCNAEIQRSFGATPTALRARRESGQRTEMGAQSQDELTVSLPMRGDVDVVATLAFLAPRAVPGVEVVDGHTYRRCHHILDGRVGVSVRGAPADPQRLEVSIDAAGIPALGRIVAAVRGLFDIDADGAAIAAALADADPVLRPLLAARPGLRLPGAADGFELAVRAVLGQQISVAAATTICGRLVRSVRSQASSGATLVPFPTPAQIVAAPLTDLGLTTARTRTLRALASAAAAGDLDLGPYADPDTTRAALLALPGVGPCTAGYILMRALRVPDAWPEGDLALRCALKRLTGAPVTARELAVRAERWRPWRGYAAMHLWASLGAVKPGPLHAAGRRTVTVGDRS